MLKPRKTKDDPEAIADADKSLREMSRLFPRGLARLVVRRGERIRRLDWGETQIAARQQRMDRVLVVDVSPSHRKVLHIEWSMRMNEAVTEQTAGYHINAAIAARRDVRRMRRKGEPKKRVTVKSCVVVLTGRNIPWPEKGELRTSEEHEGFTGVEFVIEPVYQRTVEELEAKGSLFWWAFVPLARDADEEKLRRTLERLRARTNEEVFVEVTSTMLSMAYLKKDRPEFLNVIRSALTKEEAVRHPLFEEGKVAGLQEGRQEGRQEGLRPLVYQFEHRLGRPLRESEQKRLALRLANDGPEKPGSGVVEFVPYQLAKLPQTRNRFSGSGSIFSVASMSTTCSITECDNTRSTDAVDTIDVSVHGTR